MAQNSSYPKLAWISHPDCMLHQMGVYHPEQPARIAVIDKAVKESDIAAQLKYYGAQLATKTQLARVHDPAYIENLFKHSPSESIVKLDPDTYMNPHTLRAALLAAGAVVQAVDLVMGDQIKKVFCNVRPPGHHAEHARAMGFCFFNNVAVGVAHALETYQLQRVAIVDFDVHHGNGTQDIFSDNHRVLYCSSFQHPFYPYTEIDQNLTNIVLVPLAAGTNGADFRYAIQQHLLPPLIEFQPQLIFISAGFDAHQKDDLAQLELTESDYAWITQQINEIAKDKAQGRIISVLEGGYALDVLGQCVLAHIKALLA